MVIIRHIKNKITNEETLHILQDAHDNYPHGDRFPENGQMPSDDYELLSEMVFIYCNSMETHLLCKAGKFNTVYDTHEYIGVDTDFISSKEPEDDTCGTRPRIRIEIPNSDETKSNDLHIRAWTDPNEEDYTIAADTTQNYVKR